MKKLNSVLLIDDNSDDNYFHKVILEDSGVTREIHICESGFEALDYLKDHGHKPDLIFLDINMPKMNGWEFLEEYIRDMNGEKLPAVVIMLTTSLNPSDEAKAQTIDHISGFETKPLTEEMIERIVQQFFTEEKANQ